MMTQTQAGTATLSSERTTKPGPLGPPHDGIAAVLVTLSYAGLLFVAGLYVGNDGAFLQMLVVFAALAAAIATQAYFIRAHYPGLYLSGARRLALLFLIVVPAFFILVNWVMGAFYRGVDGDLLIYALGCVAIPALVVTPVQMILRASTRRIERLEEVGVRPR